ncbi:Dual specificity protein phosphatase 19 [Nibea albiflora]|uniref:Dual specificity protein phosphatase 19 n=1 Tax=Nibea albiflora TaxID=240163 RepID=A0ACB7EEM8_NIBAL|nr:Dual specificity protein phosphatase 19 [Nibea albiflora]
MHSLAQEIQGFSKNRLKKQCTHVTTVTGRKLLERRTDGGEGEEQVEELEEGSGCGFVVDKSLDLQVGVVRPFLLLASQDAAHDIDTLQRYKVSHVLNVAYGVTNLFPDQFVYKTLQILDLPDTDITSYLGECSCFIDDCTRTETLGSQKFADFHQEKCSEMTLQAVIFLKMSYVNMDGAVLVHCNAGVSRSSSIVIGYLMLKEGLSFDDAYSQIRFVWTNSSPDDSAFSHQREELICSKLQSVTVIIKCCQFIEKIHLFMRSYTSSPDRVSSDLDHWEEEEVFRPWGDTRRGGSVVPEQELGMPATERDRYEDGREMGVEREVERRETDEKKRKRVVVVEDGGGARRWREDVDEGK